MQARHAIWLRFKSADARSKWAARSPELTFRYSARESLAASIFLLREPGAQSQGRGCAGAASAPRLEWPCEIVLPAPAASLDRSSTRPKRKSGPHNPLAIERARRAILLDSLREVFPKRARGRNAARNRGRLSNGCNSAAWQKRSAAAVAGSLSISTRPKIQMSRSHLPDRARSRGKIHSRFTHHPNVSSPENAYPS